MNSKLKATTIKKIELPLNLTNLCYIGKYDGEYSLFYKKIPMILVNYPFWTEDIKIQGDYIDYSDGEKGYSILIDLPIYCENKRLIRVEHIYYGLFDELKSFEEWLENPCFLY